MWSSIAALESITVRDIIQKIFTQMPIIYSSMEEK